MKRLMSLAALLVVLTAAPALAADEEESTVPSTGGPLVTIPVDPAAIDDMVVIDVGVQPSVGLRPGDEVRVVAQLGVAKAPRQTVILIDGEEAGEVVVAEDGSIDHVFVISAALAPGVHELTLVAAGLGAAGLGTIEVAAEAPPAPAPTTTTENLGTSVAEDPATATAGDATNPAAEAQPVGDVGTAPDSNLPLLIGAVLAAVVVAAVVVGRRRRSVARFETAATLPSATVQLTRPPKPPEDAYADGTHPHPEPDEPAPPHPPDPDDTGSRPHPEPDEPAPRDASFTLVVLSAPADAEDELPAVATVLGTYVDLATAKEEARSLHRAYTADPSEERWWEVRRAGLGAVWMLHSWAAREYELTDDAGSTAAAEPGTG